jgi:hypothetical protein
MVSVPVVGRFVVVIVPARVNSPVAALQAPGTAVRLVILQRIAQLVAPVLPAAVVAEIFVGRFE